VHYKLEIMRFELSELPYSLTSLEPFISKKTLEIHYGKLYHSYLMSLNNYIQGTMFVNSDLESIIKVAEGNLLNYASQVWNHTFYFKSLKPSGNNSLKGPFAEIIKKNFGSILFFKHSFLNSTESFFGVGWIWLVLNQNGSMEIIIKRDAGNPMRNGLFPLLTCDTWEHAYYLDYQDNFSEYIEAFWNLINWEVVEQRYRSAIL
jgi:superoxide dismutase, Fe-Mn family